MGGKRGTRRAIYPRYITEAPETIGRVDIVTHLTDSKKNTICITINHMEFGINGENGNKAAIQSIIDKYPIHEEAFVGKDGLQIRAEVSPNDGGKIIFVRPRSVKAHPAEA